MHRSRLARLHAQDLTRQKMALLEALVIVCLLRVSACSNPDVQIPVTAGRVRAACCLECPDDEGRDCSTLFVQGLRTEPCTVTLCEFNAPEVIDTDSGTGLDLTEISDGERPSSFELELGSLYMLESVRVLRFPDLPSFLSLHISEDGVEFTEIPVASAVSTGEEFFDLSSMSQTVSLIAAHVRLTFGQILLPVVTEITVFGEEVGCGMCVDQLLDSLSNLTDLINTGFDLLPTSVDVLRQEISNIQDSVSHLEGTLLVLEVVLGRRDPLEANISLPSSVIRYDLILTPSIPEKLENIDSLLNNISEIFLDTSGLSQILNSLEFDVTELFNQAMELNDRVLDFEPLLNETTNQITEEFANLVPALDEVTQIRRTVTSKDYQDITDIIVLYQSRSSMLLSETESLLMDVDILREQAMGVALRLDELEEFLVAARDRAVETNDRALRALNETGQAENLVAEINALLLEAEQLNLTIDSSLADIQDILTRGEIIINETVGFIQSSEAFFPIISDLLSQLHTVLDEYSISLAPYRPPESCDPISTPCTRGQLHADSLAMNSSFIVNSTVSVSTLMRAREFLENIDSSGELFNYTELNLTAIRAVDISQTAREQVMSVDTSSLLSQSQMTLSSVEFLNAQSVSLLERAQDVNSTVVANKGRIEPIQARLDDLQPLVPPIVNHTAELLSQTGLREEAMEIFVVSQAARNQTIETDERVTNIEAGLVGVASNLAGTAENVRVGQEALDNAESKFLSISTFLDATREAGEAFMVNVSQFIAENDRIISEIDGLIAGLADIHSRINRINSPIQFESSAEEQSYISLQAPPGRAIDDNIQFETMDMYIWTGPGFMSPSLLFYAGPTYFEGEDDISEAESGTEDYFVLTLEDSDVVLRWQMGTEGGMAYTPAFRQGHSQIFISRVGSQFQLRVGVSLNGLNDIVAMGNIANNSILFRTSNRTSFFLGGWPQGTQLGVPGSSLPLSTLNPFQGQVQLLLFNGEQWGLWNVRGSSNTMFIGSFFRNELATQNAWQGPRDTLSSTAAISFDGSGYLWVERLGNVVNFNIEMRTFVLITRPNSEEDGLVMYAYDPDMRLSMEVAYQRGTLLLIIRDHDRPEPLVNYDQPSTRQIVATSGRDGRQVDILFFEGVGFQINGEENFLNAQSRFFTNLTRVKTWFGGVREDMLESPFVPEITNSSYYGCVDMFVEDNFARNILRGSHYNQYYLNSPLQLGFSGTCLQSIYTREAGFSGEEGAYLSHGSLGFARVTNSPSTITGGVFSNVNTVSLSFRPEASSGVLLAARGGDNRVYAVMRDGVLIVGVSDTSVDGDAGHVTVTGDGPVSLGEWHYLLIQLEPDQFLFYIDGIEQGPGSFPGLNFQFSVALGASNFFLGGVDPGFVTQVDDVPPFTGCMNDLAYNFGAISLLNPSSEPRYPLGVTYDTCPFVNISTDPLLAVRPDPTQPTFCLATPPVELQNTHGGFHTKTTLTTSNVIDLFQSSWELSMLLKQTVDGHVLTIATTQGHTISLSLVNSTPSLALSSEGSAQMETSGEEPFQENVFTSIAIQCSVGSNLLVCSLLVDNATVGQTLDVFYNGSVFFPELPITLGQTEDSQGNVVNSFVGCISSLATNGDSSGFRNVRTDVPCYNNTESGLGFTGISVLGTSLPVLTEELTTVEVVLTFKPLQQNGLLLLVTTADQSDALFTVGMFNGQLRVSNFNLSTPEDFVIFSLPGTVCNTSSSSFYTLSLVYNESSFTVVVGEEGIEGGAELVFDTPTGGLTGLDLNLTVGSTPAGYSVGEGSGQFVFMLSEDVPADSLPPGLVGCVRSVRVEGLEVGVENADSAEHILVGLCADEG